MNVDALWIAQVAAATLMHAALACATGAALFAAWLAQDGRHANAPAWRGRLRAQRLLWVAALVLLVALGAWLWFETAAISGSPLGAAWPFVPTVLTQTHVGRAWSVAAVGALLLAVAAFGGGNVLRALAIVVTAAGSAALGHAADAGVVSAALGIHVLHVLATSVWGGVVLAGGFAVLPALCGSTARGALIRVARRLSNAAAGAVVVVFATGAYNAWRGTGGALAPLVHSVWGEVLLAKLALVALVFLCGGFNRAIVLPRLARSASTAAAQRFAAVVYVEALAMLGVFAAASALAHSVPGYTMPG